MTEVSKLLSHFTAWPENSQSSVYSHSPVTARQAHSQGSQAKHSCHTFPQQGTEITEYSSGIRRGQITLFLQERWTAEFTLVVAAETHISPGNAHLRVTSITLSPYWGSYSAEKDPRITARKECNTTQTTSWLGHSDIAKIIFSPAPALLEHKQVSTCYCTTSSVP